MGTSSHICRAIGSKGLKAIALSSRVIKNCFKSVLMEIWLIRIKVTQWCSRVQIRVTFDINFSQTDIIVWEIYSYSSVRILTLPVKITLLASWSAEVSNLIAICINMDEVQSIYSSRSQSKKSFQSRNPIVLPMQFSAPILYLLYECINLHPPGTSSRPLWGPPPKGRLSPVLGC